MSVRNNRPQQESNRLRVIPPPTRALPNGLVQALEDRALSDRIDQECALWRSPKMQEVREIISQIAPVDITVLILGETGAGKDLVARAVHRRGPRRTGPFIKVNCAAVARELLESELFGHERGAFTGAHQLKVGKFEAAEHGTIFLDEIGDLHPSLQGKLLHVLEDGQFSRVGGRFPIKVDVRVLAATNQNLERAVAAGEFREDLYYRLNVLQIVVPPLRERREDIPLLIDYFTQRYSKLFQREGFSIPPDVMEALLRRRFPGNVRELENVIKRMVVMGDPHLERDRMFDMAGRGEEGHVEQPKATRVSLREISRQAAQAAEQAAIVRALEETRWNRARAAKLLRISYRALLYKIKEGGLDPQRGNSSVTR